MQTFPTTLLPWLTTYLVHSTLLALGVLVAARFIRSHGAREVLFKAALFGGILTATVSTWAGGENAVGRVALFPESSASVIGIHGLYDAGVVAPGAVPVSERASAAVPAPAAAPTAGLDAQAWATAIFWAWLAVAAALLLQLARMRRKMRRLFDDRRPVRSGALREVLTRLVQRVRRARGVRLSESVSIGSPVALGSTEICVPERARVELEPQEQEGMLAHELAHLDRRDALWFGAAHWIERLFFFQPLNRILRRRLQEDAELLCDDWAARHLDEPTHLARCLVKVAGWIDGERPALAVAMAHGDSSLVNRVERLLSPQAGRRGRSATAVAALGAVALLGAFAFAGPSVGTFDIPTEVVQDAKKERDRKAVVLPVAPLVTVAVEPVVLSTQEPVPYEFQLTMPAAEHVEVVVPEEVEVAQEAFELEPVEIRSQFEFVPVESQDPRFETFELEPIELRSRFEILELAPGDIQFGFEPIEEIEEEEPEELFFDDPLRAHPPIHDDDLRSGRIRIGNEIIEYRVYEVPGRDARFGEVPAERHRRRFLEVPVEEPELEFEEIPVVDHPVREVFEIEEPEPLEEPVEFELIEEEIEEVPVDRRSRRDPVVADRRRELEAKIETFLEHRRALIEKYDPYIETAEDPVIAEPEVEPQDPRSSRAARDRALIEKHDPYGRGAEPEAEPQDRAVRPQDPWGTPFVTDRKAAILQVDQDGRIEANRVEVFDPANDMQAADPYRDIRVWLERQAGEMPKVHVGPKDGGLDLPDGPLLIRADQSTSFRDIKKIMEFCGQQGVQIWKIEFGVPEDDPRAPGAVRRIPVPLPTDLGLDEPPRTRITLRLDVEEEGTKLDVTSNRPWKGSGRYRYGDDRKLRYRVLGLETDDLKNMGWLLEDLHRFDANLDITIDARPGVVYRDVTDLLDAVTGAGFKRINFVGAYSGDPK